MSGMVPGPGRWLVEVREDGATMMSRIEDDDRAHGGGGEEFRMPGINQWFDDQHAAFLKRMAAEEEELDS